MKTIGLKASALAIILAIASIGTFNKKTNAAASKDTAQVSAVAIHTGQQEIIQQTDQTGFTLAIVNEDTGNATQTANWTRTTDHQGIGVTQDNGNTSMARSKTNMTAANGTHKANTTATTTHYGTTNVVSGLAALFGGTSQGVEIHRS